MNPQISANSDRGDNDGNVYNCDEDDGERLIKPRNNFASYSNEDIDSVRFPVCRIFWLSCSHMSLSLIFLNFSDECFKVILATIVEINIYRVLYCVNTEHRQC